MTFFHSRTPVHCSESHHLIVTAKPSPKPTTYLQRNTLPSSLLLLSPFNFFLLCGPPTISLYSSSVVHFPSISPQARPVVASVIDHQTREFGKIRSVPETLLSTLPLTASLWTSISSKLRSPPRKNETFLVTSFLLVNTLSFLDQPKSSPWPAQSFFFSGVQISLLPPREVVTAPASNRL
jgi:hypothetical protein